MPHAESEPVPNELSMDKGALAGVDIESLSPKHRLIAQYVAANPAFLGHATAAEFAERLSVSEATIVRFTKLIGFPNYKAFRSSMRSYHLQMLSPIEEFQRAGESSESPIAAFQNQILQDIQNLQASVELVGEDELVDFVEAISQARTVVVLSSGTFTSVANILVHMLRFLGYNAISEYRDIPNITGALLPLDHRDLVIGVGFWRIVKTTAEGLRWARSHGIPTYALTDSKFSPLAKAADRSIEVVVETTSFFQSMIAPLALVYSIGAYLGHNADEARRAVMRSGAESFDFFKHSYVVHRDQQED